ncbi:MAG: hypothetical protein WCN88_03515 [Candidatus Falkowbacteria bacterium]
MEEQRNITKNGLNLPDYALALISLTIIFSAGIYYLYALNFGSIALILALVIGSFFVLKKSLFLPLANTINIANIKENISKKRYLKYWPFFVYFLCFLLNIYLLYSNQSDRALISPWQVTNSIFFISYTLSSLILVAILLQKQLSATSKLVALSAHYLLSFSVAAIIYKIGYGFDPFIHQATMELIDKKGLVTPKPFYYLGEYGLIVILHKLSGLSIYLLNKFLVPVLAAIFLPLAIYRLTIKNEFANSRFLTALFLLAITFSPFIATTPQNLSYLFLILTIVYGITRKNPLWSLLLALATLAIHPLTGIPALSWCLILWLNKKAPELKVKTYKSLKAMLWLASALVLPLALFISGGSDLKKIGWNLSFIINPIQNLFSTLNVSGQEDWLLNFVYFFSFNYNLWLILLIIVSLILFARHIDRPEFKNILFINSALVCAYLISSQILFTDLINYEQTNFASRLLVLITIFFLPLIISSVQHLITKNLAQIIAVKIIWLTIGLALISSSLYISYPRFDKYFNSRGYSTGVNDIAAVKLIESTAKGPYIVLANQQVSVAALKELGFDHYYQTEKGLLYFYPIPTGGDLYQYYLDMVYKNPSRETMANARALAGVKESYLIVNKYWFQSARVISAAKLSADSLEKINDEVYIFKYLP